MKKPEILSFVVSDNLNTKVIDAENEEALLKAIYKRKFNNPIVLRRTNKPLLSFNLVDQNWKNKNKKNFKVCLPENLGSYIISKEELEDAKIDDLGNVSGEFAFLKIENNFILLNMNGKKYKETIESTGLTPLKAINSKEFIVGNIYTASNLMNSYIFLGFVETLNYNHKPTGKRELWIKKNYMEYWPELLTSKSCSFSYHFNLVKHKKIYKNLGHYKGFPKKFSIDNLRTLNRDSITNTSSFKTDYSIQYNYEILNLTEYGKEIDRYDFDTWKNKPK